MARNSKTLRGGPGYSYDPAYPFLAPGTPCEVVYTDYEIREWAGIKRPVYMVRFDGVPGLYPMYSEELI